MYNKNVMKSISISNICIICNKELKNRTGLAVHLKSQHQITYEEYIKIYCHIDLDLLEKEWNNNKGIRKEKQLNALKSYTKTRGRRSPKDRMSEDQYQNWRENMKGIFSKEWYIKKYGFEKGEELYKKRSMEVSKKSYFKIYNKKNENNWSKISQELFWGIYKRINKIYKNIYFAELNHEYGCETQYNFDFVVLENKKIIEFNGDKWHANPFFFEENEIPIKFTGKNAKEIWEFDTTKNDLAKNNGYSILVIWENEYIKNKNNIILKCIDFLLE